MDTSPTPCLQLLGLGGELFEHPLAGLVVLPLVRHQIVEPSPKAIP